MLKTGQTIKITKAAHAYRMGGIVDPSCIIPEKIEIMKIVRISKTKKGTKVHVRYDDNTGYAILLEQFLANEGYKIETVA